MSETLADQLQRLCCAETEGKFFDCVTDNIDTILAALRNAPAQGQPDPEDRTIFVLREIARGRFDNGRPLGGETARQMARHALGTWPGRTSTVPSTICGPINTVADSTGEKTGTPGASKEAGGHSRGDDYPGFRPAPPTECGSGK